MKVKAVTVSTSGVRGRGCPGGTMRNISEAIEMFYILTWVGLIGVYAEVEIH